MLHYHPMVGMASFIERVQTWSAFTLHSLLQIAILIKVPQFESGPVTSCSICDSFVVERIIT